MAVSRPHRIARILLALALPGLAGAILPAMDLPISLDADSSEFDRKNNILLFRNIQITQGDVGIVADQATATGLDFENSHWDFVGHVNIVLTAGTITAETAKVEFADHQLTSAVITGSPAAFEHRKADQAEPARGRAGEITYDVVGGTITLKDDAWLSEGGNEIRGSTLLYRIAEEKVLANPEPTDDRVRITISPKAAETSEEDVDEPEL